VSTEPDVPAPSSTTRRSFIHRIVALALAQPTMVIAGAVAVAAAGVWSFSRLPIDAYPDLSSPTVEITTQWPGHAAEEVERLLTVPIETEMNGLPGLDVVRSISLYGLSDVRLVFKDGTDNYFARERVFEKLRDVDVPDGVSPDVAPLFSPSGLVYRYVLQSPDRSPMELKTIQDWVLSKAGSPARACRFRQWPRRWARTTATRAAGSTPRAGNSTTCAGSAGSRYPRTSARSSSR
jgi:cobalt-zinc-cadmium resistance protein CzcA